MSDFSLAAAHDYWFRFKDQSVYKIILAMESVEDNWTIENSEVLEEKLDYLSGYIESLQGAELQNLDKIIAVISHLKISQMLRVLQYLDEINPGSAAKILEYAEKTSSKNSSSEVFLSRNVVFERLRLLFRILAPERLSLIQSAIEEYKHA
jgi:hypothetical protein